MAEIQAHPPTTHGLAHPAPTLEERERNVLAELARDVDAWVSFQGIRRRLGLHQQILSRTLRRLQEGGLVSHDGRGYQLTDKGVAALQGQGVAHARPAGPEAPGLALVEALLPAHAQAGDVAALLSRRWFSGLRWFGQSDGPGETALHWVTEGGSGRVTVRVSGGALTLEVAPDAGDPEAGFRAVRPLLAALAELYGSGAGPASWRDRGAA